MKRIAFMALTVMALSGATAYAAAPEAMTGALAACCEFLAVSCGLPCCL